MGTTNDGLLGICPATTSELPPRTPGPLGWNDAASPEALVCMPKDTPGPAGTGGDSSSSLFQETEISCEMPVPVVAVDLDKMRRLLYTTAYAEATDKAANRGFGSTEVDFGNEAEVEKTARGNADMMMDELQVAIQMGPNALQAFIDKLEMRKEKARTSLKAKTEAAVKAGHARADFFGGVVKVLSVTKFVSTVTVKTVSIFTGGAGTAIDFAYSGAQAGIDQAYSPEEASSVQGVVVEETAKNTGQEVGQWLNELVANGLMTKKEKDQLEGLLGNYKGNANKINEQIKSLEKRIEEALGKEKLVAKLGKQKASKVAKLSALRLKSAKMLVSSGRPMALAKKAGGKVLTVVFLASEVKQAWDTMNKEFRASD